LRIRSKWKLEGEFNRGYKAILRKEIINSKRKRSDTPSHGILLIFRQGLEVKVSNRKERQRGFQRKKFIRNQALSFREKRVKIKKK